MREKDPADIAEFLFEGLGNRKFRVHDLEDLLPSHMFLLIEDRFLVEVFLADEALVNMVEFVVQLFKNVPFCVITFGPSEIIVDSFGHEIQDNKQNDERQLFRKDPTEHFFHIGPIVVEEIAPQIKNIGLGENRHQNRKIG